MRVHKCVRREEDSGVYRAILTEKLLTILYRIRTYAWLRITISIHYRFLKTAFITSKFILHFCESNFLDTRTRNQTWIRIFFLSHSLISLSLTMCNSKSCWMLPSCYGLEFGIYYADWNVWNAVFRYRKFLGILTCSVNRIFKCSGWIFLCYSKLQFRGDPW